MLGILNKWLREANYAILLETTRRAFGNQSQSKQRLTLVLRCFTLSHCFTLFGVCWQSEFSFCKFLIGTQGILRMFCVHRHWNCQNGSILSISNLRLTFLKFSENPFKAFRTGFLSKVLLNLTTCLYIRLRLIPFKNSCCQIKFCYQPKVCALTEN